MRNGESALCLLTHRGLSFDAHKQELEKHCYYMPGQNKTKRLPLQVDIADQSVEKRDLAIYGEV